MWPPEREIGWWGDRGVEDPTIACRHRRSGNWVEREGGGGGGRGRTVHRGLLERTFISVRW